MDTKSRNILLIASFFLCSLSLLSFGQNKKYVVYFKDKTAGNPYTVSNPGTFLSAKSILRRANQNLSIDSTDLPVKPSYLQGIANSGALVLYPLKWLNGAVIDCPISLISNIEALPYVLSSKPLSSKKKDPIVKRKSKDGIQSLNYGPSDLQNQMLGIDSMHAWGFHGEGMTIAVMDAGFFNVNNHEAFSPLFQTNRILGVKDFIAGDGEVYQDHWHGGSVLSNIGGYLPGKLIGGAFQSKFYLLRTEDAQTENEIECAYWCAGIEYADSAGVDILNSSLGYTTFDNSALDYTYSSLDGATSLASKTARMAASKGIIVVCSAGNEGNNTSWGGWISVPSDADKILTIGSVSASQTYSSFSGRGPTSDGRIKPDLVAQGASAVVADVFTNTEVTTNSGTSFSAPIMSGLVAGFWQAHPNLNAMQVMSILKNSGSNRDSPDNFIGWGVPNFIRAHLLAGAKPILSFPFDLKIYPNPNQGKILNFELLESNTVGWASYKIIDTKGRIAVEDRIYFDLANQTKSIETTGLSNGIYSIQLEMGGKQFIRKVILY